MRLLYLTHRYLPSIGGVQRSVHTLARGMQGRGHEVGVACHQPAPLDEPSEIPVLGLDIPTPFSRGPRALARLVAQDAINRRRLEGWAKERDVQLVHAHLINVDTRYARPLADRLGVPMMVTLRGGETEHWMRDARRVRYVRRVLEQADHVTALAGDLLSQAIDLVPDLIHRSTVIPNPCDAGALRRRVVGGLAGDPHVAPYALFVGRLEPMKDVATLIDAVRVTTRRDPERSLNLVLCGDGSLRADLEARAADAAPRIRFTGNASYDAALALIRGARVLVLPSVSSEGCPNVVLEAMALGTPVLASDLPVLRDLLDDGAAGGLFRRGDADALASLLLDVAHGEAPVQQWTAHALDRLATHHDPDRVFAACEDVYRSLRIGS